MNQATTPPPGSLQRYDGRVFDVEENGNVLTIKRPSAPLWLSWLVLAACGVSTVEVLMSSSRLIGWLFSGPGGLLMWSARVLLILSWVINFGAVVQWVFPGGNWLFLKEHGLISMGRGKETPQPLAPLRALKGWHKGRGRNKKFFLAFDFLNGESVAIGRQHYATSEASWRHDAAQVAAFLDVPLEIPPV